MSDLDAIKMQAKEFCQEIKSEVASRNEIDPSEDLFDRMISNCKLMYSQAMAKKEAELPEQKSAAEMIMEASSESSASSFSDNSSNENNLSPKSP